MLEDEYYCCRSPLFEKVFIGKILKEYKKSYMMEVVHCSEEDEVIALRLLYKVIVPLKNIYTEKNK